MSFDKVLQLIYSNSLFCLSAGNIKSIWCVLIMNVMDNKNRKGL